MGPEARESSVADMGPLRFVLFLAFSAATVRAQQQGGANSFNNPETLQYLFDRPVENIFYPKGRNGEVRFNLPPNYVDQRYRATAGQLADRFGGEVQGGRVVNVPPADTRATRLCADANSLPRRLKRNQHFSTFVPLHRQMVGALVQAFMEIPSYQDFASSAFFCRDFINPFMFSYATSVAILHRNDTRGAQLPLFSACFPEKFFDRALFTAARQEVNLVDSRNRVPIEIPLDWTGTNLDPEHRVAYFREDMGINLGHWHWHLVYPFTGPDALVRKDRRGEIFYYFHQQVIARYNFERLCNNLGRVRGFKNFREPIEEGYFPKLDSLVASRTWAPRQAGAVLSDVNRPDIEVNVDIADLERWRDRIFEAIHRGSVEDTRGTQRRLDVRDGIELLGNLVEASTLSVNPNLYGDMHNQGHLVMGLCHDPDQRFLENYNVMGDPGVNMRDPIFYKWHSFVDDLFHEHKRTLPAYTEAELGFNGVRVTGARVETQGLNRANEFSTFWQQDDIDFSRGLDFQPRGPVLARITHLQHAPFVFRIQVQNTGAARQGTVRIFLAPRFDERMTPLRFEDQRLLFIELDKFPVNLRQGNNTFVRLSNQSVVTIPYENSFRDLETRPPQAGTAQDQFNYCGCGWPQHMLLPKGSAAGFDADLFVMVSNYADDRVEQPPPRTACSSQSYCGIFGQRYPDRRPMGFPFDRRSRPNAQTLATFLTPNMVVTPVKIRFTDITRPPAGAVAGGLVNRIDLGNTDERQSAVGNRGRAPNNANGAPAPNNGNRAPAPNNGNRAPAPNNGNRAPAPNNGNRGAVPNNANRRVPPAMANRPRAPVNGAPVLWN